MKTSGSETRAALMERLVNKTGGVRSEATIQSDVRMLLLDPELDLAEDDLDVQLEAQVGKGRRIDAEVGCTVIEVKKSLHSPTVVTAAIEQLSDYVRTRSGEMGQRYVGILTDGKLWIAFHEVDDDLREATRHVALTGATGAERSEPPESFPARGFRRVLRDTTRPPRQRGHTPRYPGHRVGPHRCCGRRCHLVFS